MRGVLLALLAAAGLLGAPLEAVAGDRSPPAPGRPSVLSQSDSGLYREIFALQQDGKWRAADDRIARLGDRRLMGHVLAQRYLHPTAYRSKYQELKAWLQAHGDHPDAPVIYKLAQQRRPKGAAAPRRPVQGKTHLVNAGTSKVWAQPYRSSKKLSKAQQRRVTELKRQIRKDVRRTRFTATERLLESKEVRRLFDQVQIDQARAQVAAGWFYHGDAAEALRLAGAAAERSGVDAPGAHWIAGLAAWRQADLERAVHHFEHLAGSRRASGWLAAAGAYWAARAHLRLRAPAQMSRWLASAAEHPRTFYGLLAQRALGMDLPFELNPGELDGSSAADLARLPGAVRALALLQVGERARAEAELKTLSRIDDHDLAEALLDMLDRGGFPRLTVGLAQNLCGSGACNDKIQLQASFYPIPPWSPQSGYRVDRALLYALIRQESSFDPRAKSADGARGLMQIMPGTAGYVARMDGLDRKPRRELYRPEINLDFGQRYLAYLLDHGTVRGDLLRLMVAYNGGPGNLGKWLRQIDDQGDPLLFIESLPSRETRVFIERVLSNLWIYRARLGQAAPSLDAIAAGDWPGYAALDGQAGEGQTQEALHHVAN
jgi:soluble lytic murein transglycosylase-like protein